MKTRTLIKTFTWEDPDFPDVELGPNTRLNGELHKAQLDLVGGVYPTTDDLYVKSRLTTPRKVRQLLGFEARVIHAFDAQDRTLQLTSVAFRLDDGTDEWFWNGAAWAVAGPSDWNTEQEIADNIATYDVLTARQFRVVVNLKTTREDATPFLEWVKVLYTAQIESFIEDMVYRSLIPALRDNVRPVSQAVVVMPATGTTFDISDLNLEAGHELVGIDSVYNYTLDADGALGGHAPDLLDSFASPTVTLNTSVTQGQSLVVLFTYRPVVAWNTSQDFVNAATIPAVIVDEVSYDGAAYAPSGQDQVINKGSSTAVVVQSPEQGTLSFTLRTMAGTSVDSLRLQAEVEAFIRSNPLFASTGNDERYRLHLVEEFSATGAPGQGEIRMAEAQAVIMNFRRWLRPTLSDNAVTNPITFGLGTG